MRGSFAPLHLSGGHHECIEGTLVSIAHSTMGLQHRFPTNILSSRGVLCSVLHRSYDHMKSGCRIEGMKWLPISMSNLVYDNGASQNGDNRFPAVSLQTCLIKKNKANRHCRATKNS